MGEVLGESVDRSEPGKESGGKPSVPLRRPWHAPQFMLTDIALSDAEGGVAVDDHNFGES
jgi:hypothetical protein